MTAINDGCRADKRKARAEAEADSAADVRTVVHEWFALIVDAISDGDPTGHIPNCGYTEEQMTCGCAALGGRLHAAITARLGGAR